MFRKSQKFVIMPAELKIKFYSVDRKRNPKQLWRKYGPNAHIPYDLNLYGGLIYRLMREYVDLGSHTSGMFYSGLAILFSGVFMRKFRSLSSRCAPLSLGTWFFLCFVWFPKYPLNTSY